MGHKLPRAPTGTPINIVSVLSREINAAAADPKMTARFSDLGGTSLAGTSDDFAKLISEETDKWSKVIRAVGIKLE